MSILAYENRRFKASDVFRYLSHPELNSPHLSVIKTDEKHYIYISLKAIKTIYRLKTTHQ